MQRIKTKLMKVTFLTIVLSFMMCGNAFASSDIIDVLVGSGDRIGYLYGWNLLAGNGTTGYYAECDTSFTPQGNSCSGITVTSKLTFKNGSTTLFTNSKSATVVNSYGTQTWAPYLHSGFHRINSPAGLTSTTVHSLSGTITYSTTLVTSWQ